MSFAIQTSLTDTARYEISFNVDFIYDVKDILTTRYCFRLKSTLI